MLELDGNTGVSLLQDNTVSTGKIVDGAVTASKLATAAAGSAAPQRMMLMAAKNASGNAVDFSPADGTGIPSWAKKVTITLNGVSTNGSSPVIIQLGTSAGVEVTAYSGQCWYINNASPYTACTVVSVGFGISAHTGAADLRSGIACVSIAGSNIWSFGSTCGAGSTSSGGGGAGVKTLSGTLDRIRITTVNGTDQFDAGSVSLLIEG